MDEKAGGELRECPFCGLSAKVWFDDNADQKRFHYWTVGCRQQGEACKVEPQTYGNYKTKEEAIAAWNRRSLPVGMSEGEIEEPKEDFVNPANYILALKKYAAALRDLAKRNRGGAGEVMGKPREPTHTMLAAAERAITGYPRTHTLIAIWHAMYDAAPAAGDKEKP